MTIATADAPRSVGDVNRLTEFQALLGSFSTRRILVIGDVMLDEHVWGTADRVSPEAPVLVVHQTERTRTPGGAGNAAANLACMGARVSLIGVIGDDLAGRGLCEELTKSGIDPSGMIVDPDRKTTTKTRIVAHRQQVVRIDVETREPISPTVIHRLLQSTAKAIDMADGVLVSDYAKGVLSKDFITGIVSHARHAGKPVFVNPKPSSTRHYAGVTFISLNRMEAEIASGLLMKDRNGIEDAGRTLVSRLSIGALMITLGAEGIALFQPDQAVHWLDIVPVEVHDPCGCGDSAIAAAVLSRVSGASWVNCASMANLAGSAKVRRLGVVPVSRAEIETVFRTSLGH
jgi:D-beta-D-heptose 7-phosphate kinase/D-beta-D-heptose 1-phosphate adenosyltransferase